MRNISNISNVIFGPTKEANGIWRIKTNNELEGLIKHRKIINYVRAQQLSWFGHTNRMPETIIVKRIHKWKPFTGRPAGRPKSRWEDGVRNDLKKMKLRKWAEQVQDRSKLKDIGEKAKTVSELWRHRRRRRRRRRRIYPIFLINVKFQVSRKFEHISNAFH